jgi:hypothetical protein
MARVSLLTVDYTHAFIVQLRDLVTHKCVTLQLRLLRLVQCLRCSVFSESERQGHLRTSPQQQIAAATALLYGVDLSHSSAESAGTAVAHLGPTTPRTTVLNIWTW